MKAFFLTEPGQTVIRDTTVPTPRTGEALLRVRRVGLCGTDLNSFRGNNPLVTYPRIPGHEIAATIVDVSGDVPDHLRPGMNVAVSPYTSCGVCSACRNSRPNACRSNQTLGVQRDGALTEFITAPWQRLYTSESLSLQDLALVEPLAVGFHAAKRGRVEADDTVVVLGCGTVGLGSITAAAGRGATVVAVDLDEKKLTVAEKAGAAHQVNPSFDGWQEQVQVLTQGGPDVVIEAVGTSSTFRAAIEMVAFCGRVVYVGYVKEPVPYETKLFVQKELDILGSRNSLDEFAEVIRLLEAKGFPTEETVTELVPLERAGEALRLWSGRPSAFTKIQVNLDCNG